MIKKMRTKKIFLTGILMLTLMFAMTMISAAITFNNPSSSNNTVTGATVNFSITVSAMNYTHCNWSTTADGVFAETVNSSADYTDPFNNITDTTALTEVEDTTLTVNCSNTTSSETSTLLINIDNTAPTCASSLAIGEEVIKFMSAVGITPTTSSSDTTDLTYAWTLWDPSGNSQDTSTSSTPDFNSEDFDEIGSFLLGLSVTDEAYKTTACTNLSIDVQGANGDTYTPSTVTAFVSENKTTMIMVAAIALILIAVVSYLLISMSKKR